VQLLRREYEISSRIRHPFILGASFFLPDSPKGAAIMMEYVEGENLRDYLVRRRSAESRRKILFQIFDAVEYLHRAGLLHNDIKADNILITAIGGDVKVIDFGLAENDADFLNRKLGGTVGASAPEVLDGNTDVRSDASSDIFALGGIIRLLFPSGYGRIVECCHRADPAMRYRDVDTLRKAIKRADRRPAILVGVFLVLCVLAAIIGQYVRQHHNEGVQGELESELTLIKEEKEERMQEEEGRALKVSQIRQDLGVFYKAAADSIADPDLVHFQEFAGRTISRFAGRFGEYRRAQEPEMYQVCDTVYERMLGSLHELQNRLPSYTELGLRKQISPEENSFYLNLYIHGKPYEPYRK